MCLYRQQSEQESNRLVSCWKGYAKKTQVRDEFSTLVQYDIEFAWLGGFSQRSLRSVTRALTEAQVHIVQRRHTWEEDDVGKGVEQKRL